MVLGLYLYAAWAEKPWMVDNVSSKLRSSWYTWPFSTARRNRGTYVQQVAVDISFLTKDSQNVWSKLIFFLDHTIEGYGL